MVDTDTPTTTDAPRRSRSAGRIAAGALFLVLAVFWGWIFVYQLQNQGEADMPDRLDDLAWTARADEVCGATNERIAALPPAPAASTATERAEVIDAATTELAVMLDRVEAIAPQGDSEAAELTAAWLADYRTFLDDRRAYAEALRDDPDARFVVTERYGSHITKPLDRFARVNEMEACMTSGDV